jgi:hypothetical protein
MQQGRKLRTEHKYKKRRHAANVICGQGKCMSFIHRSCPVVGPQESWQGSHPAMQCQRVCALRKLHTLLTKANLCSNNRSSNIAFLSDTAGCMGSHALVWSAVRHPGAQRTQCLHGVSNAAALRRATGDNTV